MRFCLNIFKLITGILTIFVFLWSAGLMAYTVTVYSFQPERTGLHTDAIVVLTGGNFRIKTGLNLWADGLAPELYITGVHSKNTRQKIIKSWQGEKPLPFCCMTLDYEATTTIENASETKQWIQDNHMRSVRLVTSKYHMPRASLEFSRALPDIKIYLHPVMEKDYGPQDQFFWDIVFLEYHKYIWRRFQFISGYEGTPWKVLGWI